MNEYTTPLSPYKFAKKEGKIPQMVYGYIQSGRIKCGIEPITGNKVLSPEEMNKWSTYWSTKREVK
jgi:ribosomal protein L25 (general stress protein Ctc)